MTLLLLSLHIISPPLLLFQLYFSFLIFPQNPLNSSAFDSSHLLYLSCFFLSPTCLSFTLSSCLHMQPISTPDFWTNFSNLDYSPLLIFLLPSAHLILPSCSSLLFIPFPTFSSPITLSPHRSSPFSFLISSTSLLSSNLHDFSFHQSSGKFYFGLALVCS